ncbi:MAG: hypothetical protein KF889_16705 [Alphaproteobacteria bacterium]|nr:hypothetical protein [Alphaproteobacteria bacterium]MCW5739990.1 hypothetical protein [Alphaproteobacteria bacterium]
MRDTTFMPRTVSGPGAAEPFIIIYDFMPTGYRLADNGRMSKPTGAAATGSWKAYRVRQDGTLEIARGRGILRHLIEDTLRAATSATPDQSGEWSIELTCHPRGRPRPL